MRLVLLVAYCSLLQYVLGNSICVKHAPMYFSKGDVDSLCGNAVNAIPADCAKTVKVIGFSEEVVQNVLKLCTNASSVGPAVCYNQIHIPVPMEFKSELCNNAEDAIAAECANIMYKAASQHKLEKVRFMCQHGRWNATFALDCMKNTPVNVPDKWTLCKGARNALGPVNCTTELLEKHIAPKLAMEICNGALSNDPAKCYLALPRKWDKEEKAAFCKFNGNMGRVDCAMNVTSTLVNSTKKMNLCKSSNGIGPAMCANALSGRFAKHVVLSRCTGQPDDAVAQCMIKVTRTMSSDLKFKLCKSARSLIPANCIQHAPYTFTEEERVEVCQYATTEFPVKCMQNLHADKMDSKYVIQLCQRSTSIVPSTCFKALPQKWPDSEKVRVCKNAQDAQVVTCVRDLPPRYTINDRVELCQDCTDVENVVLCASQYAGMLGTSLKAKLCKNATGKYPAPCYLQSPNGMPVLDRVQLCQGATSTMPAECAKLISLRNTMSSSIVPVCRGAETLTPANCIVYQIRQNAGITRDVIRYCQSVKAMPTLVHVSKLGRECESIIPNCKLHITFATTDQFDAPFALNDSSLHEISLHIAQEEDDYHRITFGKISNGYIQFYDVSVEKAGNYTVRLTGFGLELFQTVLRVTEDPIVARENALCDALLSQLKCNTAQPSQDFMRVQFPPSQYLRAAYCSKYLQRFEVQLLGEYRYSMQGMLHALLSGAFVSQHATSAYTKLGVSHNASDKNIRKAYRSEMLRWHPDKWTNANAFYQRQSGAMYDMTLKAYENLTSA